MIKKAGNVNQADIEKVFNDVYTKAVSNKYWTNDIASKNENEDFRGYYIMPKCIYSKQISVITKIVTDYKETKKTILWSSCKTEWMHKNRNK